MPLREMNFAGTTNYSVKDGTLEINMYIEANQPWLALQGLAGRSAHNISQLLGFEIDMAYKVVEPELDTLIPC